MAGHPLVTWKVKRPSTAMAPCAWEGSSGPAEERSSMPESQPGLREEGQCPRTQGKLRTEGMATRSHRPGPSTTPDVREPQTGCRAFCSVNGHTAEAWRARTLVLGHGVRTRSDRQEALAPASGGPGCPAADRRGGGWECLGEKRQKHRARTASATGGLWGEL